MLIISLLLWIFPLTWPVSAFLDGVESGDLRESFDIEEITQTEPVSTTRIQELVQLARSGRESLALQEIANELSKNPSQVDKARLSYMSASINRSLALKTDDKAKMGTVSFLYQGLCTLISSITNLFSPSSMQTTVGTVTNSQSILPDSSGSELTAEAAEMALIQEVATLESENLVGAPIQTSPTHDTLGLRANGTLAVPAISQYIAENNMGPGKDYRGSWCGPTSVRMCAEYYGITGNSTYTLAQWCEYTFKQRIGTPLAGMDRCVKNKLHLGASELKTPGSLDWLRQSLRDGNPVIAHCNTKWRGHYIVVTGIIGDTVHINDPGRNSASVVTTLSLSQFTSYWNSKSKRALKVAK